MQNEQPELEPTFQEAPQTEASDGDAVARPDPGSPQAALIAWLLGVFFIGAVFFTNQFTPKPSAPAAVAGAPSALDAFEMESKMYVRLAASAMADPATKAQTLSTIEALAAKPEQRLRVAFVAAELGGTKKAIDHLDALENDSTVSEDIKAQIPLAREAVSNDPATLSDDQKTQLKKDFGWFGELSLVRGLADTDPLRKSVIGEIWSLLLLGLFGIAVAVVAIFAGLGCFVTMIVRMAARRIQPAFEAPAPGGSVYLEMVAVFVGVFLVFKMAMPVLLGMIAGVGKGGEFPSWAVTAQLGAQWCLLGLVFYPLARGVSWERMRHDLGWHSGKGVMREIGAGLFAYFAGLPLLVLAAIITFVGIIIKTAVTGAKEPPSNPILEMVTKSSALELALLFTLATVWAPFVEESLFRGALYRHLRGRRHFLIAAVVSAFAFGIMHGYDTFLLLPVMTLGFVFALMREWRSSLIGSMVAHSLHNATVLTLLFLALWALG
ncbi:MAG: CPBP family intramembrane metalloprotease [Planctomycetes bacterium]|nr:CPBP family intramembrane metalloprotease [Planctomycetota bacterium]